MVKALLRRDICNITLFADANGARFASTTRMFIMVTWHMRAQSKTPISGSGGAQLSNFMRRWALRPTHRASGACQPLTVRATLIHSPIHATTFGLMAALQGHVLVPMKLVTHEPRRTCTLPRKPHEHSSAVFPDKLTRFVLAYTV